MPTFCSIKFKRAHWKREQITAHIYLLVVYTLDSQAEQLDRSREVLQVIWDIPNLVFAVDEAISSHGNSCNLDQGCSKLFVRRPDPPHFFCLTRYHTYTYKVSTDYIANFKKSCWNLAHLIFSFLYVGSLFSLSLISSKKK